MTTMQGPICLGCKHFHQEGDGFTCDAYLLKIPDEILDSVIDHRTPYIGDRKIVFEPMNPAAAKYAADLFTPDDLDDEEE